MNDIIVVNDLCKSYNSEPAQIKELFTSTLTTKKIKYSRRNVLQDVSFTVRRGESFAIVGHNGAGKSTLLGLLLGTLVPDSGSVSVHGKIASLLELGAGFHPYLTGCENVILYAVINGMSLKQAKRALHRIVEYSELGEAVNEPIRTFSSGMIARLAFSVIANVDSDILLIDEVFSVGDQYFRDKCNEYIKSYKAKGGTLVLVSHELDSVKEMCDSGVLLENGKKVYSGSIDNLLEIYSGDRRNG